MIGGGIVGLATARALLARRPRSLVVLEAESRVAAHQTGHNSGVIHSGLYYRPGSLKARTTASPAARRCTASASERGIAHERCGKVVVATEDAGPRARSTSSSDAGVANGLDGLTPTRPGAPARARAARPRASPACTCRRRASWTTCGVAAEPGRRADRGSGGGEIAAPGRASWPCRRKGRRFDLRTSAAATLRAAQLVELRRAALRPRGAPVRRRPAACASCRSAASTTTCARAARAPRAQPDLSRARSALPVPRRALHAHGRAAASRPGRTPCWPCGARATGGSSFSARDAWATFG